MKEVLCTVTGMAGSFVAGLFGGWDTSLITLCLFMLLDYVSGLSVAAFFKRSTKSKSGALESRAGFRGLCKKCMTLVFVLVATRLDLVLGLDYIRNAVVIAFMANELISLVENAGLMGVPLPGIISKAIDILQRKSESED